MVHFLGIAGLARILCMNSSPRLTGKKIMSYLIEQQAEHKSVRWLVTILNK